MWYISSTTNNGYPYNTDFVGIISDIWTEGKHNYSLWRIDPDGEINDGYPYTYYMEQWLGSGGGGEEGEGDVMETGGHTRPTRRYSTVPQGSMTTAHHDHRTTRVSSTSLKVGVSVNGYITDTTGINALRSELNSFPVTHQGDMIAISQIYGSNIYNAVVLARYFPFEIPHYAGGQGVMTMNTVLAPTTQFHYLAQGSAILDFGTINLGITQGYELSKYTYKLYLPYSGVHSIDIRGNEDLQLIGYVDLFAGSIDYVLFVYDQIELTAQGKIGIDLPFNVQQGEMLQNAVMNSIKYTSKAIEITAAPLGAAVGAGVGALSGSGASSVAQQGRAVGEKLAGLASGVADTVSGLTVPLSSSNVSGGCSGADMYPNPCIIVKKQTMLDEGYGFAEEIGYKHREAVNDLSRQTGYIKCTNYKCGVDRATADEKAEIIRLMESGVIL